MFGSSVAAGAKANSINQPNHPAQAKHAMRALLTAKQKNRLILLSLFMLMMIAAISLVVFAMKQNMNLFFTPSQIVNREVDIPLNARIRIGGMVEKGSVQRLENEDLMIHFKVTDFAHAVLIQYKGILPDLFREGQGVVASGQLQANNIFVADEILAKHDENYMPPEVTEAMNKVNEVNKVNKKENINSNINKGENNKKENP